MDSISSIPSNSNPYLNTSRLENTAPFSMQSENVFEQNASNIKKTLESTNEFITLNFSSNFMENVKIIKGRIHPGPGGIYTLEREIKITFTCFFPKDFSLYISVTGGSRQSTFEVLIGNSNKQDQHTKEFILLSYPTITRHDFQFKTQEDNNIISIKEITPGKTRFLLHFLEITTANEEACPLCTHA